MAITPYYAMLMKPSDPTCPVRKQAVPVSQELLRSKHDLEDPLLLPWDIFTVLLRFGV